MAGEIIPESRATSVGISNLAQWVFEEFRISISKQTLSRELRALGFRKLSARRDCQEFRARLGGST